MLYFTFKYISSQLHKLPKNYLFVDVNIYLCIDIELCDCCFALPCECVPINILIKEGKDELKHFKNLIKKN